ncbi:hypothetical protein I4U23_015032 [Adineta vaga]|nr:hypothetical protein I4U23_015032 [Adineta vaga]
METPAETTKVLCVICTKAKGIFKCEGCSQVFCPKHSTDHRNELSKQLDEIALTHDLIQQTLNQQTKDPQQHPLLKKINQWESKSMNKIRQMAEEIRNEVLKSSVQHTTGLKQKLQLVSSELRQGREENDFSEIDLHQWIQKLEELKNELHNPTTINIQEDSTTLISKIRIARQNTSDIFERVCGTVDIRDNGYLVVKHNSNDHTEMRGKNEYSNGIHTLQFRIEQLIQNGWVFFGIISKLEPMRTLSYYSPSTHGWSNRGQVYTAGVHSFIKTIDVMKNDTIVLLINCDQRKIEMKNERLNRTQELSIDVDKCSFPWQLHLNLHAANTAVRILSTTD